MGGSLDTPIPLYLEAADNKTRVGFIVRRSRLWIRWVVLDRVLRHRDSGVIRTVGKAVNGDNKAESMLQLEMENS